MRKVLTYNDARRVLRKVPKEDCFWFCNNAEKRSLMDIADELNNIDDTAFRYHVNKTKNDFERWVRDKLNDKELAREISRIKTKETLFRKISERVDELQEIVEIIAKSTTPKPTQTPKKTTKKPSISKKTPKTTKKTVKTAKKR